MSLKWRGSSARRSPPRGRWSRCPPPRRRRAALGGLAEDLPDDPAVGERRHPAVGMGARQALHAPGPGRRRRRRARRPGWRPSAARPWPAGRGVTLGHHLRYRPPSQSPGGPRAGRAPPPGPARSGGPAGRRLGRALHGRHVEGLEARPLQPAAHRLGLGLPLGSQRGITLAVDHREGVVHTGWLRLPMADQQQLARPGGGWKRNWRYSVRAGVSDSRGSDSRVSGGRQGADLVELDHVPRRVEHEGLEVWR